MKTGWFSCPFCGDNNLSSLYDSFGTTVYCKGCHGQFNFPAFEGEVIEMWKRTKENEHSKETEHPFQSFIDFLLSAPCGKEVTVEGQVIKEFFKNHTNRKVKRNYNR